LFASEEEEEEKNLLAKSMEGGNSEAAPFSRAMAGTTPFRSNANGAKEEEDEEEEAEQEQRLQLLHQ
jgi:hypothetical protein